MAQIPNILALATRAVAAALLLASSAGFAQTTPPLQERNPRYRLQANDVIEIQYRYTPEYNATVSVQPDGFISLQITGDVRVADLTLDQASAAIAEKAGVRLRDPEVVVLLKDFVKQHVTVAGEVAKPGTIDLRGPMTAIEAIALSGGFKDTAKQSQVVLLRRINPEMAEVKVIDIKKMMTAGDIQEDMPLRAGDMLVVPQNMITRIDRYVKWATIGLYGFRGIVP